MPAARIKSSTHSKHHQAQRSRSYPLRPPAHETASSVSDASDLVIYPDLEAVRQVRAEAVKSAPQGRRKEFNRRMATYAPRRTYSESKASDTKFVKVMGSDVRRKDESRHGHRSHRSRREDLDHNRGEVVYVSHRRGGSYGEVEERGRSNDLRRSKTTGGTSKARHERSYVVNRATERRHSDRWTSRREEEQYNTPLRKEKHSVAEDASRSRRVKPLPKYNSSTSAEHIKDLNVSHRSASGREDRPPLIFLPFLQRSHTSSHRSSTSNIPPRNPPARNTSVRQMSEINLSRSSPTYESRRPSAPARVHHGPPRPEHSPTAARGNRVGDRSSGILDSFLRPPRPQKRPEPEKVITCDTCLDDKPISKCPKLTCSHRMCNDCLKQIFELSVTDPQHMPPKCCQGECIPLNYVDRLFDMKFKVKWNRKFQEFTTKNRIYCPAKGCGEWIKPSHISIDTSHGPTYGRKYGVCKRCKTKVCSLCNNKWHRSRECPKDEATKEFIKLAREKGWQKCYNCKATVELKEGCNHMTCACKAEFCMCCGAKWKTCECRMFSDEAVEADRLANLGEVPQLNPGAAERAYRQRMRDQERRDADIAERLHQQMQERMQELGMDDSFDDFDEAFRNVRPHFMDEEFMRRAADALSAVFNPIEEGRNHRHGPQEPTIIPLPPQNRPRQQSPALQPYTNNRAPGRQNERLVPRRSMTDYATEAEIHRPIATEARASLLAGMARGQVGDGRVEEWRRHVDPLM